MPVATLSSGGNGVGFKLPAACQLCVARRAGAVRAALGETDRRLAADMRLHCRLGPMRKKVPEMDTIFPIVYKTPKPRTLPLIQLTQPMKPITMPRMKQPKNPYKRCRQVRFGQQLSFEGNAALIPALARPVRASPPLRIVLTPSRAAFARVRAASTTDDICTVT